MNKKILFTVINDLTYDQRMQRICRSLSKAGYDVTLVGRQLPHSIALPIEPYKQVRLKCLFNKGKFFYIEYNLRLLFFIIAKKLEVIGAVDADTLMGCTMAGKMKQIKLVLDAHEYFPYVPELNNRPLASNIWKMVERMCIPAMDQCYTVGQKLAEQYSKEYGKPFQVIRNLPYKQTSGSLTEKTEKFILYQGALNEGRGLEELLEAIEIMDVKLKIAGEGDLSNKLRQKTRQLGITHKVEFLGYLKPAELRELTAKAFIGYNLLNAASWSYYYSLSNKFFEYIQAGIPCITNSFPEYEAINEEHEVAWLTELKVEKIQEAIEELFNNSSLYQRLQNNCKAAAEVYNWEQEEQQLLKVYESL